MLLVTSVDVLRWFMFWRYFRSGFCRLCPAIPFNVDNVERETSNPETSIMETEKKSSILLRLQILLGKDICTLKENPDCNEENIIALFRSLIFGVLFLLYASNTPIFTKGSMRTIDMYQNWKSEIDLGNRAL